MNSPPPTRREALRRLASFLPRAGKYARTRNFDLGPGDRSNVSTLSPYLRTRLITEEEVARAVLGRFAPSTVEKFLQEIAWRTYWKGWLEMRPRVWRDYLAGRDACDGKAGFRAAVAGRTGIDCFDFWARELVETGYLHNHARMWFASIWIFTLRLPWQLGAAFFLRHLLDGDPASNTLSWRWVAGLHTRGKHYQARATNISKFTAGRFDPAGLLDETASPLPPEPATGRQPLDLPPPRLPAGRLGHLIIPDDLAPLAPDDVFPATIASTAGWFPEGPAALGDPSSRVLDFHRAALDDALVRAHGRRLRGEISGEARGWVERENLDGIVLVRPTVGPWRDLLDHFDPGVPVHHFVRDWDRSLWPLATSGFFGMKKRLPEFFRGLAPTEAS